MNKDEQNFINTKMKMLNWANQFNIFCLLDNNGYDFESPAFEYILAVGAKQQYNFTGENDLENLQSFYDKNPTWLFGHFGYNAIGNAYSERKDTNFSDGFFFEPTIILQFSTNEIQLIKGNISLEEIKLQIENTPRGIFKEQTNALQLHAQITKETYLEKIKQLQQHIKRGDCYEINFCQQFVANNVSLNPLETYKKLIKSSPAPFGSLYKLNENYCLCASPERFLKKIGRKLISQPIKGTSRRDTDLLKDEKNKNYLLQSQKEKSENVMVVDLVRNDMSMVCKKGSVKVKELFGIYSFPQVHQMISTIEGEVDANIGFTKLIEACYPMGSMTGAPKQRVMELIEQYEEMPRGLFSGSIGYITPSGNFDFNVVIRSVFYNEVKSQVTLFAGSGITFYSNAEEEYDECMAKLEGMVAVLA
jgi:para-aminobenzoate synthetase component I